MARMNLHTMKVSKVYPLYVQKAERKGRTRAEVDALICWLTGYSPEGLQAHLEAETGFEAFFDAAPAFNPASDRITGVICGVRVEEIDDPVIRKIRMLDKLIDELARGKPLEKIQRA